MFCFLGQRACLRLRRHVDDIAFGIELPAVIEAAQAAFLVAAEGERSLAVRTGLAEQAELAVAVAERDELLAEKLQRCTGAPSGVATCSDRQRRHPVAAHQPAHRRIALDATQQLVFRLRQHGRSPQSLGHRAHRAHPGSQIT